MKRRGAFTLAEVLVAAGVLLLLIGLCTEIFLIASKGLSKLRDQQGAQAAQLTVQTRMHHDAHRARNKSLLLQNGQPPGGWTLSMLTAETQNGLPAWDSTGQIIWQAWVQYRYRGDRHTLERQRQELSTPSADPPATMPPAWPVTTEGHRLAEQVEAFDLRVNPAGYLDVTFRFTSGTSNCSSRLRVLSEFYATD